MNFIIITTLFIASFNLVAQEISCETDNEITRTAKELSVPNCHTEERIEGFIKNRDASFCIDCKSQFEKFEKIAPMKKNVQEDFFQASLHEYNT